MNTASVLFVDDVAENRELLVRRLKRLGLSSIEQAANGRLALEAIARGRFDLVLLDIMMPEMDGYRVLEQLKAAGATDLPVIVISALNEIDPIVRCIELGAEDFIFKPFNPTLLRARVLATLEKKSLRDSTRRELQRRQAELAEARSLQLSLVPPPFQGVLGGHSLDVAALLEPAYEIGGDLVDHFTVGDDLLVLVLGDVSDKGAAAALVMARTHASFRALASRPDARDLFSRPEQAVATVNAALSDNNPSAMFVTLVLAAYEPRAERLTYVRAGHVPPLLRGAGGGVKRLDAAGGLPLGMMEGAAYASTAEPMRPGERLLIITDGVTEASDPDGALFGMSRVEAFHAACGEPGRKHVAGLSASVRAFEAGRPASDDLAAVLLTVADGAAAIAGG